MITFKEFKKKALKDKEIKKYYEELGPEYAVIELIIEKRIKEGITQKELAKRAKTKQPIISRFERGEFRPTLQFLNRITNALGAKMKVTIK